jgi:hypothetical protein
MRNTHLPRPAPAGRGSGRGAAHCCTLTTLALFASTAALADPLATFEAHCSELPPTRFEVVTEPLTYREDPTQSIDQLTLRSGNTPATRMTFGLTVGSFGHRTEIEIRSIEDRANARACGTLNVRVRLSMQPVTVYLAEELDISRCARTATWEHEMKHVAVFRQVLDEASDIVAADIAGRVGTGVQRASSQQELERRLNDDVNRYLSQFIAQWQRVLSARQDAVDSPQEYARVSNACNS